MVKNYKTVLGAYGVLVENKRRPFTLGLKKSETLGGEAGLGEHLARKVNDSYRLICQDGNVTVAEKVGL